MLAQIDSRLSQSVKKVSNMLSGFSNEKQLWNGRQNEMHGYLNFLGENEFYLGKSKRFFFRFINYPQYEYSIMKLRSLDPISGKKDKELSIIFKVMTNGTVFLNDTLIADEHVAYKFFNLVDTIEI